jgi:glutaredoxin
MVLVVALLFILSLVILVIGGIMCIVAAFQQGILWGLAYMFVPFAWLVFLIKYWEEAKTGFLTSITGGAMMAGVLICSPSFRAGFEHGMHHGKQATEKSQKAAAELSSQIDADRNRIVDLQDELAKVTAAANQHYKELADRRKALKAGDQSAVHQFNVDAADYQKQVTHLKDVTNQIASLNAEVDALMSKRISETKNLPPPKEVVIYSTSWCGVCKQAKAYMDGKGIAYRDVDVEKSPEGAQEYRAHGGNGSVPLIVVGDQTMTGFSPQRLDEMVGNSS